MGNIKIVLNRDGVKELLNSSDIGEVCESAAARMTNAAGVKYVPLVRISGDRISARAYGKATAEKEEKVCPKCGHSHPNCRCKT